MRPSREERFRMELAYMHKLPAIRYSTGKIIGRFKVSKEDQVRIKGLRYNVEYVKPSLTRPEIIYCQDFVAFVELISVREHILILNMGF